MLARKSPFGGNCLRETRNHHADKVDQKMPDHIGEEVVSPLIEYDQDRPSQQGDDDVWPTTARMSEGKNQDWKRG
jgi:hypothetical protein